MHACATLEVNGANREACAIELVLQIHPWSPAKRWWWCLVVQGHGRREGRKCSWVRGWNRGGNDLGGDWNWLRRPLLDPIPHIGHESPTQGFSSLHPQFSRFRLTKPLSAGWISTWGKGITISRPPGLLYPAQNAAVTIWSHHSCAGLGP